MGHKKEREREDELDQIAPEDANVPAKGTENHLRSLLVAMAVGTIIVLVMGWDADLGTKLGMIAVWCVVAVLQNLVKRVDPGTARREGGHRD